MANYHVNIDGKVTKKQKNQSDYHVNINGKVTKVDKNKKRTWINEGAFADGYQFGDVTKTILGTRKDVKENVYAGVAGIAEGVIDAGATLVGGAGGLLGADDFQVNMRNFVETDLIDEKKLARKADNLTGGLPSWIAALNKNAGADKASLLGDKSDSLLQSGGQLAGTAFLQSVGVPWYVTTGATSFGGQAEEAFKEDATYGEAVGSAAISAGAEILSEKLSGGIKFGGKTLDDALLKPLTEKIANKTARTIVNLGADAVGEGLEEVFSSAISNMGTSLYKEENAWELLTNEEAMNEYIESFVGGMIMGGGVNVGKAGESIATGRDYKTGLTENEQAVIDKEVENRIKEREKSGEKISKQEKASIEEQVKSDLTRGYIGIDTIESVLGGDDYKAYKDVSDREDALVKEFEELGKKQNATLAEQARYAKLEQQIESLKGSSEKSKLKDRLSQRVSELAKGDRLVESYNEKTRRSQTYTADLSKYNAKQQTVVKAAAESGILNNTNRTHEFVDMIAKIAADKGVSFDFTNNQKFRESGFALDGKTVNGFLKDGNISLNIESAKALNTVVGHEITHVLEGTELYGELQQAVKAFAESKGEYGKRLEELRKLYAGVEGANIENELTADLVGDYLFTDSDFVNRLSTEKPGLFKRIFEEIKYLLKTATAGSKQARELEKVKRTFEKAYKENGKRNVGTKYSMSEDVNLYQYVEDALDGKLPKKSFYKISNVISDRMAKDIEKIVGFSVEGYGNEISPGNIRHINREHGEKGRADQSMKNHHDLAKIAYVVENYDKIKEGKRSEEYRNSDRTYAKTVVLQKKIDDGFYYVVEAVPDAKVKTLHITSAYINKKDTFSEELVSNDPKRYVQDEHQPNVSSTNSIPQIEENATTSSKINVLTDEGLTMTYVRVPNQNTRNYGSTYGQNIEPAGEYMSMDTMQGQHKIEGYEYGTIQFKKPLVLEHISTSDTGWKKTVSDMYNGLTGKKLTQALIKDGYDAIVTYDEYGYSEIVNLNGTKLNDSSDVYSASDSLGRQLSEGQREYFKNSKVRDGNGALKPVYHGTNKEFSRFESVDGTYWFSEGVDYAEAMAEERSGSRIIEVYLDIKNPYMTKLPPNQFSDPNSEKSIIRYAKANGYDGVIIENDTDVELEKETFYVAFSPEQIKAVDNQNPTENQDINLSLSGTSVDIAPIGNNVYGKDIALEEIAPVQQNIPILEDIGPVGKTAGEPLKDIGPVRDDIVSQEIPNTEENAPVGRTYSPDELPTWGNVKKQETDTYAPEPESYPKKKVTTVKERNAAKLQSLKLQLKNEQDLMEKSHASYNAEIRDLQSEYDRKKNKNTKAAQELLDRIERRKNSRDNTDAFYEKCINDIKTKIGKMNTKEFKIVEQRQSKQEEYQTTLGELMGDTSTWVDKKMGIYYKVNTLRRNLRDIVRDENGNRDIEKADAIYDELQGKYNHNEAKLNREANELRGKYAELKITAEEDAYIQMLGEYRHNPDTTLTADVMKEYYEKHKEKIDTNKVDDIIASARQLYDELFRRVNATLEEQGMRPIEYREGYFPHFTDDKQGWLAKLLNWKTKKDNIPTDIAGLTEQFKPVRSYQSFDKHRTGDSTDYSFKKGLDMYVQGALDWIYHIEDIQKRRAFENEIRYRHSDQGIKDKVEAIRNNPEYDASEVQDQIDLVYKEAKNPLNNFITDFRTQTNTLAGKKHSMDRSTEEWWSREFYSTMQNISNRTTANMVVGSFSSALTNFIPITQSWAQVSPASSLVAMRDTIKSYIKKDSSVIDNSDFLTNRLRKSKKLYQSTWDKAIDKFGFMMEAVDNFTSQVVWRSKYLENMNAKMSESEAIKNADQFAENVMAGRSRGNNPTIFDAKNPFIKIATAFQLEVNNQYGYLFKDVPQDIKNEAKGNLLKSYAGVFIGAWLYNMAYSALTGRDAALDPIGIIEDLLRDLGLGDDEEPEEPAEIVGNLTESVLEELPFVGGLLGGGRIPISSALPYDDSDGFVGAIKDLSEDVANWKDGGLKNIGKEISNPASYLLLPAGGGQIRKTLQGLGMYSDKHPIAGSYTNSGKLRFSVEDTPLSRLQAALFGQWSSQNAREYIEEGRNPLGEKQTQELVETGLPMADYWKYRDGLKEQSGTQEKIEYIAGLDLPIATKNTLVNNAVQRETPIDLTEYGNLSGYEEFDFFSKNKELYNFLKENGVSYWDYKILGEDVQDEYKDLQKDSRKQKFLKENGVSVSTYCGFSEWEKDAYDWAYKNPEKYKLSQVITKDVVEYKRFTAAINNLEADKDAAGKTISGSKKKKVERYINNLNIDYGQKLILFRSLYESDDTYNYEIVEYLNERDDISRREMESILESLGFTVHTDGRVTW